MATNNEHLGLLTHIHRAYLRHRIVTVCSFITVSLLRESFPICLLCEHFTQLHMPLLRMRLTLTRAC